MRREERKRILAPIQKGSFILCVDTQDCKWAIYQAELPGSEFHSQDRGIVFTGEPYDLPEGKGPIRYRNWHYIEQSNRYDFDIDCISVSAVRAVFQSEDEMAHTIEQLREAEEAYIAATTMYRERFAVLAKLLV